MSGLRSHDTCTRRRCWNSHVRYCPKYAGYCAVRPDHDPVSRKAVWLSSDAVKAAIERLAVNGTDKAACWDFNHAINLLIDAQGQTHSASKGE